MSGEALPEAGPKCLRGGANLAPEKTLSNPACIDSVLPAMACCSVALPVPPGLGLACPAEVDSDDHDWDGMQVDYDGAYPIEGAKEASILLTRYVSRTLRLWQQQNQPKQLSTLAYVESRTGIHLPDVRVPQVLKSQPKARAFLHLVVQGHGLGLQERRHPA